MDIILPGTSIYFVSSYKIDFNKPSDRVFYEVGVGNTPGVCIGEVLAYIPLARLKHLILTGRKSKGVYIIKSDAWGGQSFKYFYTDEGFTSFDEAVESVKEL